MVMQIIFNGPSDSKSLYYTYDERGIRKIGQVTVKRKLYEVITQGLGGTTLGRPYLSGNFHTSK